MKCPYCDQEMKLGRLYGVSGCAVFWLPENTDTTDWWVLSQKKIEESDGVMVDAARKVGMLAKEKPESYFCRDCGIFLTKL